MAEYTSRTVTSVRREFEVPTRLPWGAAAEEVNKAWTAAAREYREAHQMSQDAVIPGDAIRFHPGDDCIVLAFALSENTDV